MQVIISARPAKGYWHLGRQWGHTPETFDVIDDVDAERVSEGESFDSMQAKEALAKKRVANGKMTKREVDIIQKQHSHALALAVPQADDGEKQALKARVQELEAQLKQHRK